MKVLATFTYYKTLDERDSISLLSKEPCRNPTFAPLVSRDQVIEEIRKQLDYILQDGRIDAAPVIITMEAGK